VNDFDSLDFFTDESLVPDPYPYFDHLRARCPVQHEPHHGVVAVTGYDEALAVYRDHAAFSSCISVIGPFPPLPFEPRGDDIGALIEQHRDQFPMSEHLVTQDPPQHTQGRELLKRLLTQRRLKENEEFMWRLADRQIDEFLDKGECELIGDFAKPFSLLVIADLLGVPEEDHHAFRVHLGTKSTGRIEGPELSHNPLDFLDDRFTAYIEDRRREPRNDVLTGLATAKYPDGSTPEVIDVVRTATFVFAAGQETTAKLIGTAIQVIAERPDLQQLLRDDRSRIPNFLEETLRIESPVKSDFRLTRTSTRVGGVDITAGTTLMILPGAANRDPRRFPEPNEFRVDRANVREHLAFGRGIHSCPGGPLARVEGRVGIERLLDRMTDIKLSESAHGPAGARRHTHEPTYILRGLTELHLEFTSVA
jgi:cytochrome P450